MGANITKLSKDMLAFLPPPGIPFTTQTLKKEHPELADTRLSGVMQQLYNDGVIRRVSRVNGQRVWEVIP